MAGPFARLVKNYESYGNVLHLHSGTGLAFDALGCLFKQRDERDTTGLGFGKRHGGLYLGQHGAGRELLLVDVPAGVGGGEIVKALLVGLAEVDGDLFDRGENDEHIGVEQLSELGGGKVLVDDGGGTIELAVLADDGNAAADGDDDGAVVNERLDGILLAPVKPILNRFAYGI